MVIFYTKYFQIKIFDHELLLFPICTHNHWLLIVADLYLHQITAYNSLDNPEMNEEVIAKILEYLDKEYKKIHGAKAPYQEKWVSFESPDKVINFI